MNQPTAGEWQYDSESEVVFVAIDGGKRDLDICHVETSAEDGKLISAAPDLLTVARRWLRIMGKAGADSCGCRPKESYVCCRCEVVAAIAKAEGRS